MKRIDWSKASNKAHTYIETVSAFFNGISEVAYIGDLYFVKSSRNRIYFHVGNIGHNRYGYNYEADVFVTKKTLRVEIYKTLPGGVIQIVTDSFLETLKKVALDEYGDWEGAENNAWD